MRVWPRGAGTVRRPTRPGKGRIPRPPTRSQAYVRTRPPWYGLSKYVISRTAPGVSAEMIAGGARCSATEVPNATKAPNRTLDLAQGIGSPSHLQGSQLKLKAINEQRTGARLGIESGPLAKE